MDQDAPLPLLPPCMARIDMAIGRLLDIPHIMKQIMVHIRPDIKMGLRP